MPDLLETIRARVVPAVLTATGVALVTAGLLTWTEPAVAEPADRPGPTDVAVFPSPTAPTPSLSTMPPSVTPSASPVADRVATRIVIPAMNIDLPVMKQPDPTYPACNVAMYHEAREFGQPGSGRATYIYAHARKGMFLSLLEESRRNNGQRMKGMLVEVYTSDDQLFLYEITRVLRHQTSLDAALAVTTEQLWLQTSEQPPAAPGVITPKLQLVAAPLSSGPADHAAAHPKPKPVACR